MSSDGPGLDILASIENGQAPRRILEFAARGFVPLSPSELVRAVGSMLAQGDAELLPLCEETFRTFDVPSLLGAVRMPESRPEQLDAISLRTHERKVLEGILQHRSVATSTLVRLARHIEPDLQDVLVTNQARLLEAPEIVESLFENPDLSTDIRRRADEFLEEFFLKKERERAPVPEAEEAGRPRMPPGRLPAGLRPRRAGSGAPESAPARTSLPRTSSSASPRSQSRNGSGLHSAGIAKSASSWSATRTASSRRPS
ncbi:MAG: hypothetical protein IPP07_15790 [Holophagales bacterium]|nr:hypothetical protein [Holophagales bacterium]